MKKIDGALLVAYYNYGAHVYEIPLESRREFNRVFYAGPMEAAMLLYGATTEHRPVGGEWPDNPNDTCAVELWIEFKSQQEEYQFMLDWL